MQRRKFITAGLVTGSAALAAACGKKEEEKEQSPAPAVRKKYSWRMATTWPKDFPGLGIGANKLAKYITDMSDGELEVTVYGAGEIVPAFESFDAVSKGTVEMGHGAAYYWKGKSPATQFFAAVPFGLTAQEMNAWIYYGGGQELWDELYASFNLKPFLAGNTGVQMGGWFNREINSLDDMKGLKMRMPGLGGEVIGALGATPKALPGGEIFTSLQSGAIDATEWVGPYNDMAFGLYKAAKYYYYPGWHEPGTALETFVNKQAYDALPKHLQHVVATAAQAANMDMLSEFVARNGSALDTLISEHGVILKRFPDEVMKALKTTSEEVVNSVAEKDTASQKVYSAFTDFRKKVAGWTDLSETPYSQARNL
ncbi:TRAP transporter substrate-binding protein DctP [Candidatus Persebacteraceae bacterium Df01]|jgi:TRAP-type mannitol/chloroaromatic compound transport system substrate-binding protein|uniref:TRAP transporter substrate-binding protein DctP n=1 Tax=Candidatus Doriopsillibacter californiensis TaxID=2970740 RepID=A0ABT7QMN4_9GAMM|nr:TRAP transporter substrate-binding protein DctP [Candidatus Persebacteraceae bacterium Df01]